MPSFDFHIFVCTNSREEGHPRGCCDPAKEGALLRAFKSKVAARGLPTVVRVNKAGCMDQCEHGPMVVIYPEGVWYGKVSEADIDEIIQSHLIEGHPVERLRVAEDCLNTAKCPHKPRLV
jgi:(2Fe-2S) ferredoxin